MVVSQLLLIVFLGQWLRSQYKNERMVLYKDINHKFEEATREMTDSALFHKYILPFTQQIDVVGPVKKARLLTSDISSIDSVIIPGSPKARFQHKAVIKVQINDTVASHVEREIDTFIPGKNDVMSQMVQSMRVLIAKTENDSNNITLNYDFQLKPDTALLKKAFTKRMLVYDFAVKWETRSKKDKPSQNEFYFAAQHNQQYFGAWVAGFNGFLFKRITPQLLFSLLLVGLTGLAFVFSYRSIRSQERLNTMRQEFISNMSHELKTPLSTAKVTIEALKTYNSEKRMESAGEYLDIAYAELNRLDGLINDVLNTSMMESGQVEIDPVKTDLDAMIQTVIKTFHLQFQEKKTVVNYVSYGPVMVMADVLHVQGVITNLIDNSLKYAKENPVIDISIKPNENKVNLVVCDNGPGIPTEYLNKIFDKFFRIPTFDKHNIKGYGLGLNYAKLVMEKHSESIFVSNNDIAGCTFTLTFKRA